jgi:hypothetical protein
MGGGETLRGARGLGAARGQRERLPLINCSRMECVHLTQPGIRVWR